MARYTGDVYKRQLLLFVADNSLVRTMDWGVAPLALAGVLAVAVMVPLIRMKTDQAPVSYTHLDVYKRQ